MHPHRRGLHSNGGGDLQATVAMVVVAAAGSGGGSREEASAGGGGNNDVTLAGKCIVGTPATVVMPAIVISHF